LHEHAPHYYLLSSCLQNQQIPVAKNIHCSHVNLRVDPILFHAFQSKIVKILHRACKIFQVISTTDTHLSLPYLSKFLLQEICIVSPINSKPQGKCKSQKTG